MNNRQRPTRKRSKPGTAARVTGPRLQARIVRKRLETLQDAALPELPVTKLDDALARILGTRVTRREVLKAGALAAGTAALPGAALAVGLGAGRKRGQKTGRRESRTYLFDLSWTDTDEHDVVLAAHPHYHKLTRTSPGKLSQLRKAHPVLARIPDGKLTHYVDVDMPADAIQLCYLQRFRRGASDGRWDMLMMFIHHPVSALAAAVEKEQALLGLGEFPKVADKWENYGLTGQDVAQLDDPVGLDTFKDSNDTACTMISGHPEMLCLDPDNSAYIQNTITSQNSGNIAGTIDFLGPACPPDTWVDCSSTYQPNASGWATLQPLCNPDTGQQAVNSQTGALQYMPDYSDTINDTLNSDGLQPSLASAKQDTTLGGNITAEPDSQQGLIWRTQDGVTTSAQTDSSLGENTEFSYTTRDFSPGHGYSITIEDVDDNPSQANVEAVVTIRAQNWYVRYLGLFVRYLDSDGNIIKPEDVEDEIGTDTFNEYFEFNECCFFNTDDDAFLDLLSPEFELYGMPLSETDKTFEIPVPASATSIVILGSGMGASDSNSNPFSSTSEVGTTMTGIVSLGLTMFFLALQAAEGVAPFIQSLEENENIFKFLPLIIELFVELMEAVDFHDPSAFIGLGVEIGNILLGAGAKSLVTYVSGFIAEAEVAQDVLDTIPIFGLMYSAIIAIGTLAQLAQSATDVLTSPSTYAYEVTLTHDIEVTVRPNLSPPPDGDPNGWPATATHFDVIALFDGGTPTTIRGELPPTQTTDPQTVTFRNVPLGGRVSMSVGVYSGNNYLVGTASSGTRDNLEGISFDITFKEILVPIDATTVYSHKEVIELDAAGKHVWVPSSTPPAQAPSGCSPSNGQLCSLNGITVNSATADVGQSFQSYNSAVPTCTNPNSHANGHQFSNISSTQDPESGFFFTGCTFSSSPRLAYDLLNRNNMNFYLDTSSRGPNYQGVIRQVRLGEAPGFDAPDSNRAWGKLQHPSDSLLLHPGGKIISIANTRNKFEVIDLPDGVQTDADAPFSHTYSARGLRPGLLDGPVLAALDPDGTILVLEDGNRRIQAFDLNGNAAPIFPGGNYFVPLKDQPVTRYLDFAVEFKGYMYVLSIVSGVFTLDIYEPTGEWLAATTGFEAQRIAVNYWRDMYAQNSQVLRLPDGSLPVRTEPSISHWIPSTP